MGCLLTRQWEGSQRVTLPTATFLFTWLLLQEIRAANLIPLQRTQVLEGQFSLHSEPVHVLPQAHGKVTFAACVTVVRFDVFPFESLVFIHLSVQSSIGVLLVLVSQSFGKPLLILWPTSRLGFTVVLGLHLRHYILWMRSFSLQSRETSEIDLGIRKRLMFNVFKAPLQFFLFWNM